MDNQKVIAFAKEAGWNNIHGYDYFSVSKFAELIAQECAEVCSEVDGGENMFSRAIREHFGVEQ